jgi:hypothetical protein
VGVNVKVDQVGEICAQDLVFMVDVEILGKLWERCER